MRNLTAAACVAALSWPAAAQAYEVHISIMGAGQVTETTSANLVGTGCTTSASNATGSIGANCYPGDPSGDYAWGWTVRYVATPKSGYRFVQWQSDFEDVTAPSMATPAGPSGAVNGATAFTFSAASDPTLSGFECRVINVHDWTPCSSGRSQNPASSGGSARARRP